MRALLELVVLASIVAPLQAQSAPPPSTTAATVAPQVKGFPGTPVGHRPRIEIPWNRFYNYAEVYAELDRIEAAWPGFVRHEVIGHSVEGRELRVYTIHNPAAGSDRESPAMWIDGNVHGNEVQGAEAVMYVAWYLFENYGAVEQVTELVDRATFYLLPMVNPDGRAHWFDEAHSAHSSRTGVQPTDDDGDGLLDEDPDDDLDGDGHITQMRKNVPGAGTHRLDPDDSRILTPVPANDRGLRGDWILLGEEGTDDDGDGRINEDGAGGYDMNRAWPSMWMPTFVQNGAGPYPLYWPETRSIARFLVDHPNVAALQSFHNSGGMILRGPGAEAHGEYEREDLRVWDELGADGEKMLPFYRYMILWKDLYSVFGGFVTWAYEGLGIFAFTNEMWSSDQMYPDRAKNVDPGQNFFGTTAQKDRLFFDDTLLMGAGFVDWHPYEHPLYGRVEIGGFRKDVGRVPPTFMIEEMVHRNALFCLEHARAMPVVTIEDAVVSNLGEGVMSIDVVFRNTQLIPTRAAQSATKKIGTPDVYTCEGKSVQVLAGGFRTDRWRPEEMELAEREPERLVRERGIPGRGEVRVRWFVRGKGERVTIGWKGEKAKAVKLDVKIQ